MTLTPRPAETTSSLLHGEGVVAVFQRSIMPYRRAFLADVARRLGNNGIRLVVFSADEPTAFEEEWQAPQPRYVRLGSAFRRTLGTRDMSEDLIIPRGLFRALWRERPDVIVTEDISGLPANLCVPLIRLVRGTPYLIWTLGPSILGKRRSRWRALVAPVIAALRSPANGFIAYSNWGKDQLEREFHKPVFVAPNSTVPLKSIPKKPQTSDGNGGERLRVVFIGRLTAQKRVDLLIEAMAQLGDRVEAAIVGDGTERAGLEALAASSGISDRIRFLGDIRDEVAKSALIDLSDVGVMPGLGGLFIQEAQSRGCAVLAGPADGTEQDLVRAANPGLYLEQGTAAELAGKLLRLHEDRSYLAACRAAAQQSVVQTYNLENMVEGWVAAVEYLLVRSRARRR
jgi:glycosyltransferase involved in cell wall biosynthesis